jgi:hypothetical protein
VSQALTLYTTPAIYIFFDRVSARFAEARRRRRERHPELVSPAT